MPFVKLVACSDCHAQYDVTSMVEGSAFDCRCGTTLEARSPKVVEAAVSRCSACGAVARGQDDDCSYCGSEIVRAAHRGGLICPECMARNLDDARFCLACGTGFKPRAPIADTPELRCPCCERWMGVSEVGGLVVQECQKCHGMWAAGEVFSSLLDRAAAVAKDRAEGGEDAAPRVEGDNPAKSRVEYRRCPACDDLMGRKNFRKRSGVIIDVCRLHGTWLDAHELERIAGFVLSGRANRASQMKAQQRTERGRPDAYADARRARSSETRFENSSGAIFSGHRERNTFESILDLLTTILD